MYYRLNDDYALRAWKFVNHALFCRLRPDPIRTDEMVFDLLLRCDGEHDLEESDVLTGLRNRGIVSPCDKGDAPSEWSRFREYGHRFVPSMNLMITGKCNYNCRHCFNAADNAERMSEWSWDDLMDLFDQAADCGFHSITLTGGEPMLYPRFMNAVREIYRRNMVLEKLTTNGYFLSKEVLEEFTRLGCRPQIKISFDGLGYHDRMRGRAGAEERTLDAFRLCAEKGFSTMAQVQVNRENLDTLRDTLIKLEEIGVNTARLIRTTAVPRWVKNAPDGSVPMEDYFEMMLDLADWYLSGEHTMDVVIWQYLCLFPKKKACSVIPVRSKDGEYHPTRPVCQGNRTMMAVTCEGDVVPCLQIGGTAVELGYKPESLKQRRLAEILSGGQWLNEVCANHYKLRQMNAQCDACPWFRLCAGGCRALAMLGSVETGGGLNYFASDPVACLFFKGGWLERVKARLSGFAIL